MGVLQDSVSLYLPIPVRKLTHPGSWAYFEVKQLDTEMEYEWYKINIFVRWLAPTNQTIILAFDTKSPIAERIPNSLRNPELGGLHDPFWGRSQESQLPEDHQVVCTVR